MIVLILLLCEKYDPRLFPANTKSLPPERVTKIRLLLYLLNPITSAEYKVSWLIHSHYLWLHPELQQLELFKKKDL